MTGMLFSPRFKMLSVLSCSYFIRQVVPLKTKTENRKNLKSMLKRHAIYLNSTSFSNETSCNQNKDNEFAIFGNLTIASITFFTVRCLL